MELAAKILSDVVIYMKYAKYIKELKRRETWEELVTRNKNMHLKKFPHLAEEIEAAYRYVYERKVLPSMRSLQFSGKPIELNPARGYNCSFMPMTDVEAFSELMFLLLSGVGVGYSVQLHHVDQLPEIRIPRKERRYLVGDSIEGWADAVKVLMRSYFHGKPRPNFDFSDIRAKGSALITSGGKAPGPEPLKDCLHNIRKILDRKQDGEKLTTLEVHDINCYIADAVLAGGIRRSAMIALFDMDDRDMLTCKVGQWWELNPARARSNNSAVVLRHKITKTAFDEFWKIVELSNSGEPGVFFTNDKEYGTNPCAEIALKPFQFCNLTTINTSDIKDQDELNIRAVIAAFIGTLQASYTNFHYLRDVWRKQTEKEALVGVSMTGIASGGVMKLDIEAAAFRARMENERCAKLIGINKAFRVTTVKPEGTSSLVLGASSGIHAWHNEYYIRRMRVGKDEPIYNYLKLFHPELVTDEVFRPDTQAVIEVPQKAPVGAITRHESATDLLERVSHVWRKWIKPGHRKGSNYNNVSTTVTIKADEWESVGNWMWEHRDEFTALACLPFDCGSYVQAPFEDITKEEYESRLVRLQEVDLSLIMEDADGTSLQQELACSGGACEIR
jgi:ribonucleoside-triphosphate reductase